MKRDLILAGLFIAGATWLYMIGAPAWGATLGGWVLVSWADARMGR